MAWRHSFEHETDVPRDALWAVISDLRSWPELDTNIERLEAPQHPGRGSRFILKPKGGPVLHFVIGEFEAPSRYSDVCSMPLASMTTLHAFDAVGTRTRIRVEIVIDGPISWLWGLLVGRKHASGVQAQTERIVARARQLSSSATTS